MTETLKAGRIQRWNGTTGALQPSNGMAYLPIDKNSLSPEYEDPKPGDPVLYYHSGVREELPFGVVKRKNA